MASDDPFDNGGKTVIRPNPGGALGRRVPPVTTPSPSTVPQPHPGSTNPDRTQISNAPFRAPPTPLPPRYAPTGSAPTHQSADDDWMKGGHRRDAFFPESQKSAPLPVDPAHKIPLDVALAAQPEKLQGTNPLTSAAGPLLVLLGRLRLMIIDMQALPLMEHVAEEIKRFDVNVRAAGVDSHDADVAKYVLCGTADDIVQNLPGTDHHTWLQYSMLARFFQVRTSGVGFFEELDKVLTNPAARYDLLELMHACLSLGFEGQYRGSGGGDGRLSQIRRDVYEALRRVRERNDEEISPHWKGIAISMARLKGRLPIWTIAGILAALLFAIFILYRLLLGTDTTALADDMIALHPAGQLTIERPAFVPYSGTDFGATTQLDRIRDAMADDIAKGGVEVASVGEFIVVQVNNLVLFNSGSADVRKDFAEIAGRIVAALDKEPGPIRVVGHTDNVKLRGTGRFKSNFELSVARAKSVEAILAQSLSSRDRLEVEGKGDVDPVADNKTREGRARNRRVEIMIQREETL